jgi:dTDP-4-amino-4,6-dideoxygalactose transaminase
MKNSIPFSPPFVDADVIAEVVDSLNSGWITSGPKVKSLEEEVSKLTNVEKTVCVNSWSSGAVLVLKWFGVKEGDEVIIPAYTYSATALAVIQCGATPVMVDVATDFTIDTKALEKAISSKTKVIISVDIAGWPCDYDEINRIVNSDQIKKQFQPGSPRQEQLGRLLVLSDAAHSIGAFYDNKPMGKVADITIFSFHAVKNITTAEGGAICLNLPASFDNSEEYKTMKLLSLNGQSKDAFTKSQAGGWKYDILFQGYKFNMPDLCAAVGLSQIKKYTSSLILERERVARRYEAFFSGFPFFEIPPLEDEKRKSCFHLFALRMRNISELQRDKMMDLIAETGVSVNVHFIPMPMFTYFKSLGYKISDYPVAFDNYSREISLPIYPQLTDEQVDYICNAVLISYQQVLAND